MFARGPGEGKGKKKEEGKERWGLADTARKLKKHW